MTQQENITLLYQNPPTKRYEGVQNRSQYLTMRDGVKIAIDLMLPMGVPEGTRLPAIMIMARYWRSFQLLFPDQPKKALIGPRESIADDLIPRGFALVVVDGRGMGASFGVSRYPFAKEEMQDHAEVAEWVANQAWCNGRIGAFGISYEGATALRLAGMGVSAVKAVIPQEIEYDVYTDALAPGGIFNSAFIKAWNESNGLLDSGKTSSLFPWLARLIIKSVRPVDEDRKTRAQLTQAIAEHRANTDVFKASSGIVYRDDLFGETGVTPTDFSVPPYQEAIENGQAVLFSWGSWLDATTAESVLRTYNTLNNPQIGVIGAWKHEMTAHGSPYLKPHHKPNPLQAEIWGAMAQFFSQTLQQDAHSITGKRLFYYTLGEEQWKHTTAFPLPNTQAQTWHFQANHGLAPHAPTEEGTDRYTVNFNATTGKTNRWQTQMARPLVYADRAKQDQLLLTYTSEPLANDLEITGYPVAYLTVASTHADGAFYVYLEEVDANGVVRYLTEGQLRGIHRKISQTPPPYISHMPNHSFKRADASPLPVGEFVELCIGLQPTSALLRKGNRVRIAISGADADTFAPIPASGAPVLQIAHGGAQASRVVLPVIPR